MTRLKRRPYLITGVTIALLVVMVFGGRAAWRLGRRLLGPPARQTDVSRIAEWMSVPYVSRAYRVPEAELYRALGIQPDGHRMQPLREIADETGRSTDEVLTTVQATVSAWQEAHPRPPGRGRPEPATPGTEPRSSRGPPVGHAA